LLQNFIASWSSRLPAKYRRGIHIAVAGGRIRAVANGERHLLSAASAVTNRMRLEIKLPDGRVVVAVDGESAASHWVAARPESHFDPTSKPISKLRLRGVGGSVGRGCWFGA
jgi:hypothetical protein